MPLDEPELQFDHFDPSMHDSVPPSRANSAPRGVELSLQAHPLFEVAKAFPNGIPGLETPAIEALDDEQILAMAKGMSAGEGYLNDGLYTPFEMREVKDLIEFCKNRESTVLPILLRQFFSGLEYKRYQRLLLATDDRRLQEEREEDPAGAERALIRRRVEHAVSINRVGIEDGVIKRRKIEERMTWDPEQWDRRISRLGHEFLDLVRQLPNPEQEAKLQAWFLEQEKAAVTAGPVLAPVEVSPESAPAAEPVMAALGFFKLILAMVLRK